MSYLKAIVISLVVALAIIFMVQNKEPLSHPLSILMICQQALEKRGKKMFDLKMRNNEPFLQTNEYTPAPMP